jgi:hypothetical protein
LTPDNGHTLTPIIVVRNVPEVFDGSTEVAIRLTVQPERYLNEATPGLPVIKLWRVSCRLGLPGFKSPTGEIPTPLSDHIPLGGVVRCGRRCWRPLSFPSRRLRSNFVNRIAEIFQRLGRLPCPNRRRLFGCDF